MSESEGTHEADLTGLTLKAIAVTPAATPFAGGTVALTATGFYSDASTHDITSSVTWTSSSNAIAMVNATGLVTANGHGSAVITAKSGSIKGAATMKVSVSMTSIAITPPAPAQPANTTQALTATASYDNGTTKKVTSAGRC